MPNQITITIDGVDVKTTLGTNILQAAIDAGMYIPYLCYYPGMKPFGACRVCVVSAEQKGPDGEYRPLPGSPASCTTPAINGMRVTTNTDNLVGLRRGIIDLLISEHPHGCLTCHRVDLCGPSDICLRHVSVNDRCVTCPKNERCELKDTVRYLEMDLDTPLTYNNRHLPLKTEDPLWEMDMNLCIVCGRCVRVCDEVRGDNALTFTDRAGRSLIGTSNGTSLLESGCEFCGACIDVCPTGALVEREHKWDKAVNKVSSICPHCPVGCEITLEADKRNRLIRTSPNIHAPANRGQVCFKGKFGLEFVNHKERLRKPLIRIDGSLKESSVVHATEQVAVRLKEYQNSEFKLIVSPRGTNEDHYIAQKFARSVMNSNNIDISSNLRPGLMPALGDMLGNRAATNSIQELEHSKCFLVISSNITEEQNVAAIPIKKAVKGGASLIVIDPRETELTRYATIWLRPRPNTETTLIGGMLRVIFDESLEDHGFLADRCEGMKEFKNSLWGFDLIRVSEITTISQKDIRAAARLLAGSDPSAILYALETLSPELHDACVRGIVNLMLTTGNFGKQSSGLYPLYTGANEQGSKDVGCMPDYLPGYRALTDPAARDRLKQVWNTEVPTSAGLSLTETTAAIHDGRIKALLVAGDSPNFTNGALGDFIDAARQLDFLVVLATFRNKLTEVADIVLPSATFAETEGTYTNMERRVQLLYPAVGLKGDEEPDWRIISRIAQLMGADGFNHDNAEAVFNELASLVEIYGGISYKRLRLGSVQWPCLAGNVSDTEILGVPGTASPKIKLSPMELSEAPNDFVTNYPLVLARGRMLHQSGRDMKAGKSGNRNVINRDEVLEIHPADAQDLNIVDGEYVEIISARDRLHGVARLTGTQKGMVAYTSLFGDIAIRLEASPEPDPVINIEGLPLTHVRVEKLATVEASTD